MKFFHLSDLHIGKQLHHYNLCEEQRNILEQIAQLAEDVHPDAIVIAGDIYDVPVPSAEAVAVFDWFLTKISEIQPQIPVLMIAGNHDSAKRIDFASSILAKNQIYISGMPPVKKEEFLRCVTFEDEFGAIDFYLLPFVKPSYARKLFENEEVSSYDIAVKKLIERETIDSTRRNVMVSHQFYTAGGKEPEVSDSEMHIVGGLENVDIAAIEQFDYAALGHIHRAQKMGKEQIRYCGTPLQYSVSEAGDVKTVTMVELREKGAMPILTELPLTPAHVVRKLTGTMDELLAQSAYGEDYVSLTLTDEIEPYRPKERLEEVFHRILEIRIDNSRTRQILNFQEQEMVDVNPYEAFCSFFEEMNGRALSDAENDIIRSVIQKEMGGDIE